MDLVCSRGELTQAVKIVSRALGKARTMPILAGIKLEVTGNTLKLYATDLERAIGCAIGCENRAEDETLILNGEIFSKITSVLPAEEVKIKTVDDKVEILSGSVRFDLFTMPLEDYPEIPPLPAEKLCTLEREKLQRGLEQTTFAALSARETSRLSLTGVDMVFKGSTLKLVATNGYRLALKELSAIKYQQAAGGEYLVDSDSLKDLNSILTQIETEEVEIYQEGSNLFFAAGPAVAPQAHQVIFSARLIAEEYPDFEKVIPKENKIGLALDRGAFLDALLRAQITTAEESGAVILRAEEATLFLSSCAAEKGETEERVNLKKPVEKITVSFKAEYLIDALKRMSSSEVTFWLADPESAGLLEPADGEEDSGFIYVCMPIRLD